MNSGSGLSKEIDRFVRHMDSIGGVGHPLVQAVAELATKYGEVLEKFENEECTVSGEGEERTVDVPHPLLRKWKRKRTEVRNFRQAVDLLPRSLVVTIVSQYDAYIGRLIRAILTARPELMSSSERQLTFKDLGEFSSLDAAREYLLDKEVESVLRASHAEHFKYMEGKFSVELTKDLAIWPEFIEITERRNLFVHTDGKVSSHYLSVCKAHKCVVDESAKEGAQLFVFPKYLRRSREVILLMGVMLAHVLWRKQFANERELADKSLIRFSYELIDEGDYGTAATLLDFACEVLKKHSSEENKLILLINWAQAYKWKGDEEKCIKIVDSVDWSAKGDNFRLANAVLRGEWGSAAKFMRAIGVQGSISRKEYATWPLFNDFRKEESFRTAFRELYGEEFTESSENELSEAASKPSIGDDCAEDAAQSPDSENRAESFDENSTEVDQEPQPSQVEG